MDNTADPWNAAADPAAVDEKAAHPNPNPNPIPNPNPNPNLNPKP